MALKIAGFLFTGPITIEKCIVRENQLAAVFAVVSKEDPPWDPQFRLIAVGETGSKGMIFAEHPDRERWNRDSGNRATIYLFSVSETDGGATLRRDIVSSILGQYTPPDAVISG